MKSVMQHNFSVAPTADIPRSSFDRSHGYKTAFDAGYLVPIYVDEALPGDTLNMNPHIFARMATPINPVMDNVFFDIHFFSVPMRQLWDNFRKFMGERVDPADSIDFTMPVINAPVGGFAEESLFDYLGMPIGIDGISMNALFARAYNHIYNEWYRDQNLIDSVTLNTGNGPDADTDYSLLRRGKRHDYFTSCLPWLQKGDSVEIPLGTSAPVGPSSATSVTMTDGTDTRSIQANAGTNPVVGNLSWTTGGDLTFVQSGLETDLSTATAATINQLRQAFQIQKLLERDARSGTRYAEIVKSHFGVNFYDPSYRPEFLGGSTTPVNVHPVPQTSETPASGTPQGNLSAFATVGLDSGGFTKSFTEHCVVMGIASVRADLTYQQGINRMYSRSTRYDYFWPALAHIGEQSIPNKEIYAQGTSADDDVFGYQERYAEYKYKPSLITGAFRSAAATSLDNWHLSQEFSSLPGLNQTFIEENPPMSRVLAVSTEPHFIVDCYFKLMCARPMPLYSVPGLIDHF